MRNWLLALVLLFLAGTCPVIAQSERNLKPESPANPYDVYHKAKWTKKLRKLSFDERIAILDSARTETLNHTCADTAQRNKMVVDVMVKIPTRDVPAFLDSMHTTVPQFRQNFSFVSSNDMKKIVRHLNSAINEPDSNSRIFTSIPCDSFKRQLRWNIRNNGDSLFQSHSTNFCSKIGFARLWIQEDSAEYKRFMTDLYYTGRASWNGTEFVTPPEVIDAVNQDKIQWDPQQSVCFRDEEMPRGMDMVFYLTLTSAFRSFPYTLTPYDPELHDENNLWSATAINPQLRLFRSMGFNAEKVGNNVRGITNYQFDKIKAASAPGSDKRVFLLVNSSVLDTISGADTEYVVPHPLEHLFWGTHWISIESIDTVSDTFTFWEYGRFRKVQGVEQMKHIIAGGIIVSDYQPE